MRTIHKFPLPGSSRIAGDFELEMPRNADILCMQTQRGYPCVWALVDDAAPKEKRRVVVVGTGWDLPDDMGRGEYIGTYQSEGGYVWHVFATKPNALSGDGMVPGV